LPPVEVAVLVTSGEYAVAPMPPPAPPGLPSVTSSNPPLLMIVPSAPSGPLVPVWVSVAAKIGEAPITAVTISAIAPQRRFDAE
jgi:hypothetical protein